ncbi:hypothetical protein BHM03_00059954, partial [Ensete ventricosum]
MGCGSLALVRFTLVLSSCSNIAMCNNYSSATAISAYDGCDDYNSVATCSDYSNGDCMWR